MKDFHKKVIAILLLACLVLPGCAEKPAPVQEAAATDAPAATPTATPTSVPSPTPTPTPTATPTPTPSPTPTPTPTPTPSPTPTPIPLDRRDDRPDVESRLLPLLSCTPEPTATAVPQCTPNPLLENVGQVGAMAFANVPILAWPHKQARILGRESYHLFYIHNVYNRQFYYVTTQEGLTGYIRATRGNVLTEEDLARYFDAIQALQHTVDFYSPDAFLRELQANADEGTMADRVYATLGRLGLDFDPCYYQVYRKALTDDTRYPRFYKDEVYNSLLFKLFNSTGSLVNYDGHRTEWAYVPRDAELQKGDILFFTESLKDGSDVLEGCEFVMKGPFSGALTDCGVYMGENRVLLLRDGQVQAVDWTDALRETLDSARRIRLEITDEKQALIEDLIAQVYDCLGTPYNSFQRTGDYSFDCSGLISWLFMGMEITPASYGRQPYYGANASSLSRATDYYWHHRERIHFANPVPRDKDLGLPSMDLLERGDLVFLRKNEKTTQVGHVMIYLGGGRVIHSTRIDEEYGGTVVANFRPALQILYQNALRIESIVTPPKK